MQPMSSMDSIVPEPKSSKSAQKLASFAPNSSQTFFKPQVVGDSLHIGLVRLMNILFYPSYKVK